jgi:REP element-mobilizing transposase RayT
VLNQLSAEVVVVVSGKKGNRAKPKQLELPLKSWGGARKGAGRKPKNGIAGVAHRPREARTARVPNHVTLKLRQHLPRLRQKDEHAALLAAFAAGKDRFGFRLIHFVVMNDHIHLIAEAADCTALRHGLQGLSIRIARALNKLWKRKGKVFSDRFHDHVLRTPREVRNALAYVFTNARHHAAQGRMVRTPQPLDTFSSARWFDGFRDHPREATRPNSADAPLRPLAPARSWLLTTGWRRHGLIPLPAA